MKELTAIRAELDAVDGELVALFEKRMALCREVAAYKMAHGLPVLDTSREAQVLDSRAALLHDGSLDADVRALFQTLMSLSRRTQQQMMEEAAHHA